MAETGGNLAYISPSCERITGYGANEFYANPDLLKSIVHPDDYGLFSQHICEVLAPDSEPSSLDFRVIARGGEERWINHQCQAVFYKDGTYLGRRGNNRDITDRKRMEEERERLLDQMKINREQLQALSIRLVEVQELERRNLARRLHDEVGQNMTALSINMNIINSQLPAESSEKVRARLNDSLKLIEKTVERIRDVMAELRPPVLDDYGLAAALNWYGKQFSTRTGIDIVLQEDKSISQLPLATETALFRITQEALTNVAKHAEAKRITITLKTIGKKVTLSIIDDGIGFDYEAQQQQPGWGLINMRERAQAIGGKLIIESSPGKGTKVMVEVPRNT